MLRLNILSRITQFTLIIGFIYGIHICFNIYNNRLSFSRYIWVELFGIWYILFLIIYIPMTISIIIIDQKHHVLKLTDMLDTPFNTNDPESFPLLYDDDSQTIERVTLRSNKFALH